MSTPWFKYYPADWRSDPKLRMCCLAARGLWMEMLCLMHEAEPRGSLLINGQPVTDKQMANLAGCSLKEATTLISELETAGVFSRDDKGIIYSRRMRRDDEKAARDKANGSAGGNPRLKGEKRGVNPPDKATEKGEDKAQNPEARIQIINSRRDQKPARRGRAFPKDGSISFSEPFCSIARKVGRGADPDLLASAFRQWCHRAGIDFADPRIAQKFESFCGKHKVQGLHS